MKIILVMAMSVDGKITPSDQRRRNGWSSQEDQHHFKNLKNKHRILLMGRKTYEEIRSKIILTPKLRRIVLTNSPTRYSSQSVEGQLEFTDESPVRLINRLTNEGYEAALLVGGSAVNRAFLQARCINECMITIEPQLYGSGLPLIAFCRKPVSLRLRSIKKLNRKGTLVVHYMVVYDRQDNKDANNNSRIPRSS